MRARRLLREDEGRPLQKANALFAPPPPVELLSWDGLLCEQNTLTRHIFSCFSALITVSHVTLAQGLTAHHVIHVSCVCLSDCTLHSLSHLLLHPPDVHLHLLCGSVRREFPCASANEELGTLVNKASLTGYEPNFFDDYHFSETTEIFIQESSSDIRPSNLHDSEISDDTIGRALSSPLFSQEREEPAGRRQAYHSLEESLLSSQSLSVGDVRTLRPVSDEFGSLISNVRENPRRDSETEQIRILLERQKDQILADYRAEIQKHEFQADYDRRNIKNMTGIIESQRGEINRALPTTSTRSTTSSCTINETI